LLTIFLLQILIVGKRMSSHTITEKHVKLFARYTKLPISVYSVDSIDYYIDLLDKYYKGCKVIWNQFIEEVKKNDIVKEVGRVSEEITYIIINNNDYNILKTKKPVLNIGNIMSTNLYNSQNNGKRYVSFDITKGNFSVLRLWCPAIFGVNVSWYDFVSKFTDSEFIRDSKIMREIIFGKAGFTKLANSLQEHEINSLYLYLGDKLSTLYSKKGDEIIYEIDDSITEEYINELMDGYKNKHIFKSSIFTIHCIDKTPYFYKLFPNGRIELKTVPKKYVMQVIKKLEGKEINKLDLTGVDEDGNIYVYVKSIFD
jgi:hypothetical protein